MNVFVCVECEYVCIESESVPIWSFTIWLLKRQLLPAQKAINLQTSWATAGLGIAVSSRGRSGEQIRRQSAIYCTF